MIEYDNSFTPPNSEEPLNLEERLTVEERLLRAIFGEKAGLSEDELLARPADPLQRRRNQLIIGLGESEDTSLTLAELEQKEQEKSAEMHQILMDMIDKTLVPLSERERLVLKYRFGLEDGHVWTLKEVGREIGKSKSTAWRVEHDALRKLRSVKPIPFNPEYFTEI